ncbi:ABC transporter ATP-binding protein [Lacticaseibacillus baoqingensis]|uniref:ABC transporter ATP-binding protein n=2 Tax=Lacticaseibacillus baoqingensis TaxID=2486013 RepID=A0ABW4E5U4_9LACO
MTSRPTPAKFDLKAFIHLIASIHPRYGQLAAGLGLGILATAANLLVPKFAQTLINQLSHQLNVTLLLGVVGIFILSAAISAGSGTILGFFGEDVVASLRRLLWDKLLKLPVSYFDERKSGEISSRLVNDSTQVKDLLANGFPNVVTNLLQLFGALGLMLIMDWKMTAIMFVTVPLMMLVMMPIGKRARRIGHARQDALAAFNGEAGEILSEVRLMKSSNAEAQETNAGHAQINTLYQIGLKEAIYDSIAGPVMSGAMMAVVIGILAYGAHRVLTGTMSMGTMFSFLMYLFQIIGPVGSLGRFMTTVAKTSGATERIQELLAEPVEDLTHGDALPLDGQILSMQHVDFAYDAGKPVLQDVNFEARPNSVVAFVGPSGGGKSTIFSLLERFYPPTKGQILVGHQDSAAIALKDWRQQIGLVSQDSAIMAGTIRYNLTYGLTREFADEQLWHVLKLAYAEDFVRKMPQGLDTQVGERGVKVSGGQRQRIAIARAFLRDPKLLMLDEATASLDSESEMMVQKALEQLMRGRTTLVIAHRLSTIVGADDIYFVENGHISGHGPHAQLVKNHALYREYVHNQFAA